MKIGNRIAKSDHLEKHAPAASIQARLHNWFFFLCGYRLLPAHLLEMVISSRP
jgi:hypothetical protein